MTTIKTNLPPSGNADSASLTKAFFDTYRQTPLEFAATDVDSAVSFFEKRGFDKDAATITAVTILKQAKLEGQPIYQILDTLQGFNSLQIKSIVGEILNNNRPATSTLGFRVSGSGKESQSRNIVL
jgi:hypothetical protein